MGFDVCVPSLALRPLAPKCSREAIGVRYQVPGVRKAGTRRLAIDDCRLPIENTKSARGVTNSRPVLRGGRNPRDSGGVLLKLIHRAAAADIDSYVCVPTCIPVDKPSLSR